MIIPDAPELADLLSHWLVTSDMFHPAHRQWIFAASTMARIPGLAPKVPRFPGATHELLLKPFDPAAGPQTPMTVVRLMLGGSLPLVPATAVDWQVTATDAEVAELVPALLSAIVHHRVNPDAGRNRTYARGTWRDLSLNHLAAIRTARTQQLNVASMPVPLPQHRRMIPPPTQVIRSDSPPGGTQRP